MYVCIRDRWVGRKETGAVYICAEKYRQAGGGVQVRW